MKVFISWSGEKSKVAALALRDWIPNIIQAAEPWMSEIDIGAGERWNPKVSGELKESNYGIVCLTKDNLDAAWIHFEIGALAKTVEDAFVCPSLTATQNPLPMAT